MTTALEAIPLVSIDGRATTLGDFSGKVRLIVNVASKCGLTPQYGALEALYQKYRGRGFEIMAFPANDFGAQEPGTNAEIREFCSNTYATSFRLFAKIVVTGLGQHPLYARLTMEQPSARGIPGSEFRARLAARGITPPSPIDVLWNFEKFLMDRSGEVIDRFAPDVSPDADILVSSIERAL